MSDRRVIRENDYYGGNLAVSMERRNHDPAVVLRWEAWGGHGAVEIVLSRDEARVMAAALGASAADADLVDEEFYRRTGLKLGKPQR